MIDVKDLSVARGGVPILEGLSFTVPDGQALILRGPNGSGKTTLLRVIAGLQPARSGQVLTAPDSLAYAAHSDGVKGNLTVAENLQFWADVFGFDGIDTALQRFDLTDLSDRLAQALSAGQKRRLGLARLCVTGRANWILDEPTVSLDAASVQMFADTVRTHLATGGSALIATHIDLGLEGQEFDVSPYKADQKAPVGFDEGFL